MDNDNLLKLSSIAICYHTFSVNTIQPCSLISTLIQWTYSKDSSIAIVQTEHMMTYEVAEKLEFMKVRAVKICAKTKTGKKLRHKKPCRLACIQQNCLEKILTVQGNLCIIIGVVRRKSCFLTV
jgi:hypothetical protein